jgi:hypothetical protein
MTDGAAKAIGLLTLVIAVSAFGNCTMQDNQHKILRSIDDHLYWIEKRLSPNETTRRTRL